jgi:pilus assembly protein CpaF
MSLLKRIERTRPAAEGGEAAPEVPAPAGSSGGVPVPAPRPAGSGITPPPGASAPASRPYLGSLPARESFREAKYRVQNRLINELDPKLDLTNQVEVRRQIEELFGRIADEEGMALTRAERVRML